ncbi:SNF2 family N-terminal domain protein [Acidovorax sp. MR-S7]|nr:SNF2 family N-terminal domain protein [Acidovorax sp. MR-S7]
MNTQATEAAPAADTSSPEGDLLEQEPSELSMSLQDFVSEFGDELLESLNRANPPVYDGTPRPHRQLVLAGLKRQLFPAQAEVVHAASELLVNQGERAVFVNGEMGTGKTTIGIALAAVLHAEGYRRTLVLSPPHLVYKWRREILDTVAGAKVWVLNGPDTLLKLIKLREQLGVPSSAQEFFVLGRVRMRMGFHWKPAFVHKRTRLGTVGACPHCGEVVTNLDGEPLSAQELEAEEFRRKCSGCGGALWTLMRPRALSGSDQSSAVLRALKRIPTIGEATAQRLMKTFGDGFLASMLGDKLHNFINLMDGSGKLVFSDRQAHRMERAMANMEFGFGEGGYQPSEYVKRYLPRGTFDLLIADEGHVRREGTVCPRARYTQLHLHERRQHRCRWLLSRQPRFQAQPEAERMASLRLSRGVGHGLLRWQRSLRLVTPRLAVVRSFGLLVSAALRFDLCLRPRAGLQNPAMLDHVMGPALLVPVAHGRFKRDGFAVKRHAPVGGCERRHHAVAATTAARVNRSRVVHRDVQHARVQLARNVADEAML